MSHDRSITSVLAAAAAKFTPISATSTLDAELLLAHACGMSRSQLLARGSERLTDAAFAAFEPLVARRATGEPLAYILGTKDFWTLRLQVDASVLVPRPETELLVELALAAGDALVAGALAANHTPSIVDLGTGSGAIALALASERPRWKITGTDRSVAALNIARRNAAQTGLQRVEFVEGDWFAPLAGRTFDIILSNPPYIAASDAALRDATLSFEPLDALTDHADGLAYLRHLAYAALDFLSPGGTLLFEHAPAQAAPLRAELVSRGFRHVRSHRDLAGHERATEARNFQESEGHHGSLSNIAR